MLEILAKILIYSNERDIKAVSKQSLRFNYAIFKLYQDYSWWKQKVEYLLDKDFGALKIDWYDIYEKIYDRKNDKVYDDLPEILIRAADDGDFN